MFNSFKLFALTSLLAIMISVILGSMHIRSLAEDEMVSITRTQDTNISQGYIASVWKKYQSTLDELSIKSASEMQDDPQVMAFAQETMEYFQRMEIIRANIYNASGQLIITVNSKNNQVKLPDNLPSPDSAYVIKQMQWPTAASRMMSQLKLPNDMYISVVQTVIPIPSDVKGSVANLGALELLHDASAFWERAGNIQKFGGSGIIVIFGIFMLISYIAMGRAENVIAKQYDINVELSEAAAAAQAENRDKSQFLANVSHELRTPLNAIIGFSEIIKNEVIALLPEKKYHDYINDIHSSGVHLLSLINDILEYSKAEAGKLELEVSEINASKMIQNSMRLLAPRAESAEVALIESLPKDQIILYTDGKKFKQIFLNLLSNSVKFTPAKGQIRISAWKDMAEDMYYFEVRDSGIGIAPKDISRAMSPFGQVDNKLSRKYEGTGLGLPLTKKFVEMMGGKFYIESELNVGTTVTFTLPRTIPEREGVTIKQLS